MGITVKMACDWFTDYMILNEPPYYLSIEVIQEMAKAHGCSLIDLDIQSIWYGMLDHFCPIELWSKKPLNLPERIAELDDNKDYIYAWGPYIRSPGDQIKIEATGWLYIYRISSAPIAMILRMAA